MADTTDPLVITLSGAAIRTGPDHSSVARDRSTIITRIGPTGVGTDRLSETEEANGDRPISAGRSDPDRLADPRQVAGTLTNRPDPPAVIHRPSTTAVWTNGRNACPPISCPARPALANGLVRLLLSRPASRHSPVSTTRPSRPARGNPGTFCHFHRPSSMFMLFFISASCHSKTGQSYCYCYCPSGPSFYIDARKIKKHT